MKIKVTKYNEPILEITKGISAGKPVDMGTFRDRVPDRDWGEVQRVNMEIGGVKEVELTEKLKETLLGDLAYVYGKDTKTFINKLKEFEIL